MTQAKVMQLSVTIKADSSAISQLMHATDLSQSVLTDAAEKGAIWSQKPNSKKIKRIRDLESTALIGHTIFINYNEDVLSEEPLTPELVSDQVNYSIWYNPKGMLSQGSKWGDHCTITQTVKHIHGKSGLLVHRLDKATSGLMVIAHTKEATRRLTALFAARQVEKFYRAQVNGTFDLSLPLVLNERLYTKPALTIVESVLYKTATDISELTINIQTGRKHQIRQHLSQIGFPIIGDRLYGNADSESPDLQLEAFKIAFDCPFTDVAQSFEWK